MKILHINSYFDSNEVHRNFILSLKDSGIAHLVVVPNYYSKNLVIDNDKMALENVHENFCVDRNCRIPNFLRYLYPFRFLFVCMYILRHYKRSDFRFIHAHTMFTNGIVALMLYYFWGLKYVITVRNTDVNIFWKKLFYFKFIYKSILSNASRVLFLSTTYFNRNCNNFFGNEFTLRIKPKTRIIPSGIDHIWFSSIPEMKFISKELNILFVGKLVPNKNLLLVLKLASRLKEIGFYARLHVVGTGPEKVLFSKYSDVEIKFYDEIKDSNRLIGIYDSCHFLVVPSFRETFGLVYAEAIARGLPVIYTRGEGFDLQFDDGVVGFSTSPTDLDELIVNVQNILNDYTTLRLNCVTFRDKFNWNFIGKDLLEFYQSI